MFSQEQSHQTEQIEMLIIIIHRCLFLCEKHNYNLDFRPSIMCFKFIFNSTTHCIILALYKFMLWLMQKSIKSCPGATCEKYMIVFFLGVITFPGLEIDFSALASGANGIQISLALT